MFQEMDTKSVIIVASEKYKEYGIVLQGLISQRNDKGACIIGIKDGSVKATVWTDKEYEHNRATISSEQEIIFIGESESAKYVSENSKKVYDFLGMKYGWLGNMAYILVDKKPLLKEEYKYFLDLTNNELIHKKGDTKWNKENNKGVERIKYIALGMGFGLVGIAGYTAINGINIKKRNALRQKQRYLYIISHFYLNNLQEFLKV